MEETNVIYILYTSRGELVAALEMYEIRYNATHTLPERAESLHTPTDVVSSIPATMPMSYQFRVI